MINHNSFLQNRFVQFFLKMQVRLLFLLFWVGCLLGFIFLSQEKKDIVEDRSLSIYMWSDRVDESILQKFEEETGIKIYVNYYDSNEELVSKFEIAKDLNCDLIMPSDYIIQPLVEGGFLKKIDKSRCDFIDRIYPQFMGLSCDPHNEYSLPIYWDVLGIGYTKSYFQHGLPSNSWAMIFDKKAVPCKEISMIDDSREAIFLVNKYFGWDTNKLTIDQLQDIINLFVTQKAWVGSYTDYQQGYFLTSQTYPLVVSQRERIVREMLVNDDVAFTVPDEGSLLFVSNVVISATSEKDDLIYQFLNYIYKYESLMYSCKEFVILPTVQDVLQDLPFEYIGVQGLLPGQPVFDRVSIFSNILTQKQINDVWIAFKSF